MPSAPPPGLAEYVVLRMARLLTYEPIHNPLGTVYSPSDSLAPAPSIFFVVASSGQAAIQGVIAEHGRGVYFALRQEHLIYPEGSP